MANILSLKGSWSYGGIRSENRKIVDIKNLEYIIVKPDVAMKDLRLYIAQVITYKVKFIGMLLPTFKNVMKHFKLPNLVQAVQSGKAPLGLKLEPTVLATRIFR